MQSQVITITPDGEIAKQSIDCETADDFIREVENLVGGMTEAVRLSPYIAMFFNANPAPPPLPNNLKAAVLLSQMHIASAIEGIGEFGWMPSAMRYSVPLKGTVVLAGVDAAGDTLNDCPMPESEVRRMTQDCDGVTEWTVNQMILYLFILNSLPLVKNGGNLLTIEPAPLSTDQIIPVFNRIKNMDTYKQQRITMYDRNRTEVTLRDGEIVIESTVEEASDDN